MDNWLFICKCTNTYAHAPRRKHARRLAPFTHTHTEHTRTHTRTHTHPRARGDSHKSPTVSLIMPVKKVLLLQRAVSDIWHPKAALPSTPSERPKHAVNFCGDNGSAGVTTSNNFPVTGTDPADLIRAQVPCRVTEVSSY